MGVNGLALMALDGAVFAGPATGTVSFGWKLNRFAKAPVFSPWHDEPSLKRVFKRSGYFSAF